MSDVFVKSLTHLKDRPRADQALQILQRLASLVKPIMRKHGWILPVLSEFYPESPNLLGLNVNAGEKILVRLRPPHAPDTFFDEEDILHTMLHELTHNVHGPHDDKFYKYFAGLEEEYAALRRSGYDGEGFHSAGHRLGTNASHDLPTHIARQKALEAAEKRKHIDLVFGRGGRLGGAVRDANKDPRHLAAEAAERRARDDKACASGALALQEVEKAAKESVRDDVIDLTSDSDASSGASEHSEPDVIVLDEESPLSTSTPTSSGARSPLPSGSSSSTSLSSSTARPGSGYTSGSSASSTTTLSSISSTSSSSRMPRPHVHRVPRGAGDSKPSLPKPRSVSRPAARKQSKPSTPPPTRSSSIMVSRHNAKTAIPTEEQWTCDRCTLVNDALALQCAACLALRPGMKERAHQMTRDAGGWTCEACGERDLPHDFWSCRFCGSVKVAAS
ncbi:WLM-domain-containing protein [Lentinus brumalis]|uniref:WLM-domain-containing protein n=1 Tax=Lentinus brumalis TaxID=2498619 RepID=A0A371DFB3_9APHY|nr:WLM-domain-containing protein [Polyporus brumalis]